MNSTQPFSDPHRLEIRVRYHEVDGQGRVHNSQYLNYFERGRVEMLRDAGISYRELEQTGLMLVVKTMHVDFHVPAEFDDLLVLCTSLVHCHGARIEHAYQLIKPFAEETGASSEPLVIVTGHSVIACVDRDGRVKRLPRELQINRRGKSDE